MRQVSNYTLEETLYEGPETCVRHARHSPSGQKLVAKLPTSDPASPRMIGRLFHEYQVLCKLAHVDGVVRVRDFVEQEGSAVLFLVDPGWQSLEKIMQSQKRLTIEEALRIALSICQALDGVHAAGIIHKDVKPQNILVDESCAQSILIDFGIASELAQEATEASLPESLEGTLAYISPEQTGRTARGIDSRTDLYSFGVTLFELLTGRRPFVEKDAPSLVYAHLAKEPPAVDSLRKDIPSGIARIVERCLEKSPERRYQTARGLAVDLERCLRLLKEQAEIPLFALGQKDYSPKLQLPDALVGREPEIQAMTAAFERAAQGAVEVLLLGGPSGIGKTALLRSVYRDIAKARRGLLLSGKHDQLGRTVPYAALAQAFSGLMRNLAASPKPVFEEWREHLVNKLGPLLRVIADVVPELEWLTGPISALPVVPTEMAYNRLKLSWIEFVRAVTDMSPPLVLFIDDLQWVDPASLELLKTLMTDAGRKHLLLIFAYRDNEVEASHPLWGLIQAIQKSGVPTPQLSIGPLNESSVRTWLARTLSTDPARVAPLAQALWNKTQGNPFFLGQLLLELYRQKWVRRNLETGFWEWDQHAAEHASATENVVELMRRKVEELPERTQQLLGQAACAGHSFTFGDLATLSELQPAQVVEELNPALSMGLVISSDRQYREAQALAQTQQHIGLDAVYRFLHDRVQQACYERIAPDQRAKTHIWIGRRLQRVFEREGGSNQKLLEFTRHLNLGKDALVSGAEQKDLARLDLQAARAAKENGSYRLQATLVDAAQTLLGEGVWEDDLQLAAELALERIEADFMLREFDEVHRKVEAALLRPLPGLVRLSVQELRVRACLASGKYELGERFGLAALAEHGIVYPETSEQCIAQALQGIRDCDAWFDANADGIKTMPADPAPETMILEVLQFEMLNCAALGSQPALAALAIVHGVCCAIKRQTRTPATPFLLTIFASGRAAFLGDYRGDIRWVRAGGQAALELQSPFLPQCLVYQGIYSFYEAPLEQARGYYQAALQAARAIGSFQGTGWTLGGEVAYVDLMAGRPLDQIAATLAAQRELMDRSGDAGGQHLFEMSASVTAFLRNEASVGQLGEGEWLTVGSRAFLDKGDGLVAEFMRIQEAYLFLALDEFARAYERAEEAERFRSTIYGFPMVTDIPLWRGLAASMCCLPTLAAERRAALLATLAQSIERFVYFSEGCKENFLHKLRLLEAEWARQHGKTDEAMAKYDEAIELARKEGALHLEGLASQLCAEYHLAASREYIATLYLQRARDAYVRWNARALVAHLEQKYSMRLSHSPSGGHSTDHDHTVLADRTTTSVTIDVDTTIRAAQTLSSELDPQRVVAELMRLVQENAGAQRAALLLHAGGELVLMALLSDSQVQAGMAEPLSASHPIAQSVIQYVQRSRAALVSSDVATDSRFATDPYLRSAAIHSVLAVPLLQQGRLSGILYLDHKSANAFPEGRVRLLGVLAAQSAIALENARLYAELQSVNSDLEAKVAERTAALNNALKELWTEMDLAQQIQTVLLPKNPKIPGYDLAAAMIPADQVGGDYYDVFRRGKQDWVLIGDVSGHGVPAGLCMMMIQTALRIAALVLERTEQPLTPNQLLSLVNEGIEANLQQIGRQQYMTITALCIEDDTVTYAGLHQDVLIYRAASQKVERIETTGLWLGIQEGSIRELLPNEELRLEANDVLLLHTDGYTEARAGGRMIGTEKLADSFAKLCNNVASSAALLDGLLGFLKPAVVADDVTLVALRRLPA